MTFLEELRTSRGRRGLGLLLLAALLVVFAACQLVAGVESRSLDPIPNGCALPTGSGPQIRFANLAPTADAVDVCIRTSGASSWGEPILLGGGAQCGSSAFFPKNGFTYGQISVAFAAPSTSIDFKTVKGGSTCSAAALSEADHVSLAGGTTVTTFAHIGGAANQPIKLAVLPEWNGQVGGGSGSGLVRLVNAMPGVASLDFGTAMSGELPTTLSAALFDNTPIAYGGTAHAGDQGALGAIKANGYIPVLGTTYNLAAAAHGQPNALFLFKQYTIGDVDLSVYAIGVANSDLYPQEALLCVESSPTATKANPLLFNCLTSQLPTLSFDVFNPALYGFNAPDFQDRETVLTGGNPNVPNPIPARNSDVMCLVEVDSAADQQAIIAAAKAGGYAYSYTVTTTLSTPPSNGGKMQDGGTCPASTTPACSGVDSATVDTAVSCVEQHCSTVDGGTGVLDQSTSCLSNNCFSQLADIKLKSVGCFNCLLDYVASGVEIGTAQSSCTMNAAAPVGDLGANSSLILSRYPLVNSDAYILPSTNYRRSVLYSQVQFPENLTVDFYCGFLITPLIGTDITYLGCYGNGQTDSTAEYDQENLWQATEMAAWVKSKSGGNPAVIVGDWRSGNGGNGPADAGSAQYPPPTPLAPDTMTFLTTPPSSGGAGWTAVQGMNWPSVGECNYCPTNALNQLVGDTNSYFVEQPFLVNWPGGNSATVDEQLIYTDNVLTVSGASSPNAPVSPYYGLNFHLLRPSH